MNCDSNFVGNELDHLIALDRASIADRMEDQLVGLSQLRANSGNRDFERQHEILRRRLRDFDESRMSLGVGDRLSKGSARLAYRCLQLGVLHMIDQAGRRV
jgi:hypothetical protein